jgi:hypothetical protein
MLTESQKEAIAKANAILETAGLEPSVRYTTHIPNPPASTTVDSGPSIIPFWRQRPSVSRPFSIEDQASRRHIINRQCIATAIAEQSINTIVEYPEVTAEPNGIIVHRFAIDPDNFYHPKYNIQYSLSGQHHSQPDVFCGSLLTDGHGKPVYCQRFTAKCMLSNSILLHKWSLILISR